MSDCCNTTVKESNDKKHICPSDGKEYSKVPFTTVNLHLKKPWSNVKADPKVHQSYYFCSDPNCDVVYFTGDNSVIKQSKIRTLIGIKNQQNEASQDKALICYCFDITFAEARKDPKLMQYVIDKTKNKECACDSQNPAGKCCLIDFKRLMIK